MTSDKPILTGLTAQQVVESRAANGTNEIKHTNSNAFLVSLKDVVTEPMFILLVLTASIYVISGKYTDALFMLAAIVLVSAISLYQDARSRNALAALEQLTKPQCKVIRDGEKVEINSTDVVLGDLLINEEGSLIAADGVIIQANDFSVNESLLTGESMPVFKSEATDNNQVYRGTSVSSGLAICRVEAIGSQTQLGKIGESLQSIKEEDTPLQIQIQNFVKGMAIVGVMVFLLVWGIHYFRSRQVLDSLLQALTLAMSILPEEIPVAFTTFMALGAWRLMKLGIVVKQTKTVETLGSATVICTDKTGTITENQMTLAKLFAWPASRTSSLQEELPEEEKELIRLAMWSSEPIPFDPMEVALHEAYGRLDTTDERANYRIIHEYPLSGKPPMMTHVFENASGHRIIAAKGAAEAMMKISGLTETEMAIITQAADAMAAEGYRVLGVGMADFAGENFPEKQQQFSFVFKGLVAFYDPPKKNMAAVFESFYKAGIAVKIVTGDNAATTTTIAKQVGFRGAESTLTGDELMAMSETELKQQVMQVNIFTRMFPEAKLRIINALKANGQIVAMTGDGVNDGPALKAAHIGIAMGKRGSEIAKEASSLILVDDDLARMSDAVAAGRKIYDNLKKAIQYIISIHIPIILTVSIPLFMGWIYPSVFSPIHIIFLEMIMGPTCSIIFENEPMEQNTMLQKPRPFTTTFFRLKELLVSIFQGLFITAGTLSVYQYAVLRSMNENTTRTMVFVTLVSANTFLTLVNRSFYYSLLTTLRYKNRLIPFIVLSTLGLCAVVLYVPAVAELFEFEILNAFSLGISITAGVLSVIWFEGVKWFNRRTRSNPG